MIRQATHADGADLLAAARACPCVGARLETDWALATENPRLPYHFYLPGDGSVLALNTQSALLAAPFSGGVPAHGEELALFLSFSDTRLLFSDGWAPPGWQGDVHLRMRRPSLDGSESPGADPPGLDRDPRADEVIAVLESGPDTLTPPARDRLYSDLQTRRNHGRAAVWGIRGSGGRLEATAGAWALTDREAYIACVETRPDARGQGHARALMGALSRHFAHRALTLVCKAELRPFYEGLGFAVLDERGVLARSAAE